MKMIIDSEIVLPNTFRDIAYLTDRAKLDRGCIEYNPIIKMIKIQIKRRIIVGFKKDRLVGNYKPVYAKEDQTKSLLLINEVISFKENINYKDSFSDITLLFGIKIESNEIYISSVEESQGKLMYEGHIKIKKLSLELRDLYSSQDVE